jgi:hypothetical protein
MTHTLLAKQVEPGPIHDSLLAKQVEPGPIHDTLLAKQVEPGPIHDSHSASKTSMYTHTHTHRRTNAHSHSSNWIRTNDPKTHRSIITNVSLNHMIKNSHSCRQLSWYWEEGRAGRRVWSAGGLLASLLHSDCSTTFSWYCLRWHMPAMANTSTRWFNEVIRRE